MKQRIGDIIGMALMATIWLDTTMPTGIFDELAYGALNGILVWMVARARKGKASTS